MLVTTLTKKMAEDLTDYLQDVGLKVRYIHSDIDTIERVEIIRDLRRGVFDVLVGINLLREGLDLPEVSLVAILDADKEGYLRSARSLIQTIGRAARNVNGTVIMYADTMTDSMKTRDRRDRPPPHDPAGLQRGARHHAADDPQGDRRSAGRDRRGRLRRGAARRPSPTAELPALDEIPAAVDRLRKEMKRAARGARVRDAPPSCATASHALERHRLGLAARPPRAERAERASRTTRAMRRA